MATIVITVEMGTRGGESPHDVKVGLTRIVNEALQLRSERETPVRSAIILGKSIGDPMRWTTEVGNTGQLMIDTGGK